MRNVYKVLASAGIAALAGLTGLAGCTQRFPAPGDGVAYRCGGRDVVAHFDGPKLQLDTGDDVFNMETVISASGARYAVPGDLSTIFWTKADWALLTIRGEEYPQCIRVAAP